MRTKTFLAAARQNALRRETAWGCLTTNIALPGAGSLIAGRLIGVPQLCLSLAGMALTLIFGVRFIKWSLQNWSRLHDPASDPIEMWSALWLEVKWPLVGIACFVLAAAWALITSWAIVARSAPPDPLKPTPPPLG